MVSRKGGKDKLENLGGGAPGRLFSGTKALLFLEKEGLFKNKRKNNFGIKVI